MKLFQLTCLVMIFFSIFTGVVIAQQTIYGPVAGSVTSNSAEFIIGAVPDSLTGVELSESEDFSLPLSALPTGAISDSGSFRRFIISGLKPETRYFYRLVFKNPLTIDTVKRSFSTFPGSGKSTTFSFLTGSCEKLDGTGTVFPQMARENAAFFLQQGDWGYPDTTIGHPFSEDYKRVEESYKMKYSASYPMRLLLSKMPVDYTYDDHDMAGNNSDSSQYYTAAIRNSIQGYLNFFPHYPLGNANKGLWHKFTYGNADIFMLDNRSQRDPNRNSIQSRADSFYFAPKPGHSILGDEQMNWLLDALGKSTATWKFISSGTPFNPALRSAIEMGVELQKDKRYTTFATPYGYFGMIDIVNELTDKWAGFPSDVYKLLKLIHDRKITNVIFLSGDTHTSGLDDGTNSVLPELMAGPLDIKNNGFVILLELFGIRVFNKGGHTIEKGFSSLGNAYGRVTVFGSDSVRLEAVSDKGLVLGSNTVKNGFMPEAVSATAVPDPMIFDTVGTFASKAMPLIITNNSVDTLLISGINISDPHFSIQTALPLKVAPVNKAVLKVIYRPSIKGETSTASLNLISNSAHTIKPISLSGIAGSSTGAAIPGIPGTFELFQNYPNPFNPFTTVTYYIPFTSEVSLIVYDSFGREIKLLDEGLRQQGFISVKWDGTNNSGQKVSSGIYLIKMQADSYRAVKKIMLLK